MKSDTYHPAHHADCEIGVHGNGFPAHVRTFKVSSFGFHPMSPGTLTPGDTIRLEIAPQQGDPLTVRLGVVRWIDGDTVDVEILLMDADDKLHIDEIAWASVRGEVRLFHWLRRSLWGEDVRHINLSYAPRAREDRARMLVAA